MTRNDIEVTFQDHLFALDNKKEWWGEGEWVEEVDVLNFYYREFRCEIIRVLIPDGPKRDYMFGGYLCGYVNVLGDNFDELIEGISVHGGVTFCDRKTKKIGFDCSHSFDVIPSMCAIRKQIDDDMLHRFPTIISKDSLIFNRWYKNIDFCIEECKSIVNQIITQTNERSLPHATK